MEAKRWEGEERVKLGKKSASPPVSFGRVQFSLLLPSCEGGWGAVRRNKGGAGGGNE